jgi:serine/threonine protein kinase/tetratricopeptide (TPR) repeat protein
VGVPSDSDREAILGFDCVHRVAQSYLGPLWIAADVRSVTGELGLVRRLALPDDTPDSARREIAELGRKAVALVHPNVLGVREVLEQGDQLIVVYAAAEAEPLRSLQSWANLRGLSFPIGVALRIMVDLLQGLAAMHEFGQRAPGVSFSGGLSPDSVLIVRDGTTKLCDPLIASAASRVENVGFNTAKLAYAAPEQVRAATPPTPRADVFTCAAMLWELLASRRLLAGSRPAIERKLLDHDLPGLRTSLKAPASVSDELVALVEGALSANPSERPSNAAEFARRLAECGHEIAPIAEVAAFVGKLSGPRFDRRTAAIRSRSSGSLALDGLELPREAPKSSRDKAPGVTPTSEIETPRTAGEPAPFQAAQPPRSAPRPFPAAPANAVSAGPATSGSAASGSAAPVAPSAPRPAASALQAAALEAAAQRADRRAEQAATEEIEGLDEWKLEEISESSSPDAVPAGSVSAPMPFAPAPVEPPSLGFASVPSAPGRNPALWDQMVASTTPPVTNKRAEAPLGMRTITGLGVPPQAALAPNLPFANLTPAPFPEIKEAAPSKSSSAAPPVAGAPALDPNDPFGIGVRHSAAPSNEGPLPFEHLLRSKRGPSQPSAAVEPNSQNWFALHARPKATAPGGAGASVLSRPWVWVSLIVALGAPAAWFITRERQAAVTVIAEPPEPAPPAPPPAAVAEPPRSAIAPVPPTAPKEVSDAGAQPTTAPAATPSPPQPRPAGAADFTAAKLDDSQLVVLFALEGRNTLPTCAERLGDSIRKYSGNDMTRSVQQVKAARRKLGTGDAVAAHELACSAIAHSPRNPTAQRTLAEIALSLGDPAQAKTAVERALAQTPKDKGLIAMRGDVLAVMGDIAGSRAIWLSNAVAKGNKVARTKKLVLAYRKAGEKALGASDWGEAAAYFRRAVVLTHGAFVPSLGLSEALLGLNHSRAALVWAERAAQAFPKDSRIQVLFGDALHENGQSDKARDAWQTALTVEPSNRVAARRLREGKP